MNIRLEWGLARAEVRRSRGRLLFCVLSIAMGVFALTAVRSVTSSVNAAFAGQARETLGADVVLSSNSPLPSNPEVERLEREGARTAARVRFYSMLSRPDGAGSASAKRSSGLVRVHAVDGAYPFYGTIHTDPVDQFRRLAEEPCVLADPRIVRQLGLRIGDVVRLGQWSATLIGELRSEAGSPTADFSMAPPLYMHRRFLPATQLVQTGSRVDHEQLIQLPEHVSAADAVGAIRPQLENDRVRVRTAEEATNNVRRFLSRTSRFMTIAGLVTLLLGALGIASALRAFMQEKLDHAAILRCLGMTPRGVSRVYALLALGVASAGSLMGAAGALTLPLLFESALQRLGQDFLPAGVTWQPSLGAAVHGVIAGVVSSLVFTSMPLLQTARVSPLRVLRRDVETSATGSLGGRAVGGIAIATFGAVLGAGVIESESWNVGLVFSLGIAGALLVLWLLSVVLVRVARLVATKLRAYSVRQGIANLHRPGNQTISVVVAVGLGVLCLTTLLVVQYSLVSAIAIEQRSEVPNLFVIDVQPDQTDQVSRLVRDAGVSDFELNPMVAARIAAVERAGQTLADVDSAGDAELRRNGAVPSAEDESDRSRARRREYFLSYRAAVLDSETIVAGKFWSGRPERQEASIDVQLATSLDIRLGDALMLDIQGLPLRAVVTSLREIHWETIRPNSMIVLSPGEIEEAPRVYVGAVRLPEEQSRYALADRLVNEFPNLSVIDVTEAAKTVRQIAERVSVVFNGLGAFTLLTGGIILAGAVVSGRKARQRELALLKVLGATRSIVRRIVTIEYFTLASLGAAAGYVLSEVITRGLLGEVFGVPIVVPYPAVCALLALTIGGNVGLGFVVGRAVGATRPLELLRDEG